MQLLFSCGGRTTHCGDSSQSFLCRLTSQSILERFLLVVVVVFFATAKEAVCEFSLEIKQILQSIMKKNVSKTILEGMSCRKICPKEGELEILIPCRQHVQMIVII